MNYQGQDAGNIYGRHSQIKFERDHLKQTLEADPPWGQKRLRNARKRLEYLEAALTVVQSEIRAHRQRQEAAKRERKFVPIVAATGNEPE